MNHRNSDSEQYPSRDREEKIFHTKPLPPVIGDLSDKLERIVECIPESPFTKNL